MHGKSPQGIIKYIDICAGCTNVTCSSRQYQSPATESDIAPIATKTAARTVTVRFNIHHAVIISCWGSPSPTQSQSSATISLTTFWMSQMSLVAVWCSGNALVLINAVALHRARLVLGWVTAFGQVNCLIA